MNQLCDNIIREIEQTERINTIEKKIDRLLDRQRREFSFLGILFVAITTLVTNTWAQYVYNNMVTNYGHGTRNNSDSLFMLFVFTIFGVGIVILFVIDLDNHLI